MNNPLKCSKCKEEYSSLEIGFSRNVSLPRGFAYHCKACGKIWRDGWKIKNKIKQDLYDRSNEKYKPTITNKESEETLRRLAVYSKKLNWQEKPYFVLEIKLCEI